MPKALEAWVSEINGIEQCVQLAACTQTPSPDPKKLFLIHS